MKREEWQRAYDPQGDALELRVRNTLDTLRDEPAGRFNMKKTGALVLAAVLALVSAVALAAGLLRSERYDAVLLAHEALEARYGITKDMDSFFRYETEEKDGETIVTASGRETGVEERLGVYTVVIRNGKAEAGWSHDGEETGEGLASCVWGAAQIEEAMRRKLDGEQWADILYEPAEGETLLTQEEALDAAREAIAVKYGSDALTEAYTVRYADLSVDPWENRMAWRFEIAKGEEEARDAQFNVSLWADDGSVSACSWYADETEGYALPEDDLSGYGEFVREYVGSGTFENLADEEKYATARRIREAGLGELLDADYADPSAAAVTRDTAQRAACAALEEKYGLDERLRTLFEQRAVLVNAEQGMLWRVTWTPANPENAMDLFLIEDEEREGGAQVMAHTDRMGEYAADVDAQSGEVVRVAWSLEGMATEGYTQHDWGQAEAYDAPCLVRLKALWEAQAAIYGQYTEEIVNDRTVEDEAALDALMRDAGFSARLYNHVTPGDGELTQEQAIEAAKAVVIADMGLTTEDVARAESISVSCYMDGDKKIWGVTMDLWEADIARPGIYWADVNAADGTIEDAGYDNGAGGNG